MAKSSQLLTCAKPHNLTCTGSASADANYSSAGYREHSQSSPVWGDRLLPLGLTCWAKCHLLHIRETQRHVSQLHSATRMHKWHRREDQGWTLEEDYRLGWLLPTSLYQIVQKVSGLKGSCDTMSRMMFGSIIVRKGIPWVLADYGGKIRGKGEFWA